MRLMKKQNTCAIFCTLLVALLLPLTVSAQMTIVKKGKAKARIIVISDTMKVEKDAAQRAAALLSNFSKEISGASLPVTILSNMTNDVHAGFGHSKKYVPTMPNPRKGDIIIGGKTDKAGEDGFEIVCKDGTLIINSGGGRGAAYAAVTLLENYLGISYYAYQSYTVRQSSDIALPYIHTAETPAFRYRQTQGYGNTDPVYKDWFRLEEPKEVFAANYWVHTFNRILPASVYGKEHPEWYSLINGKRQPGDHSQWCLTNPEVFEMACVKIDSIFKAHPDMKMISVSQNDGNNTQCSCPECKAIDEYEGSPSGNLIRFMNKLAERFPDKEFSTLAYLYSMQPPKHIKPLPNVNIMLCDIDCRREVPLTDNASGQDFMKAIDGWSKISNNIFVWDYGINFDNVVSPFPNFHIIQKNIQIFKEHHATMLFEQINSTKGTDFGELRSYMMAKLMWNPYQDADSLMQSFLNGYYGKAAPHLYQYLKIQQGALLASGIPLWIYDSPITHKTGMLNSHLLKIYNELFDHAENAVRDEEEFLKRVRIARLPLQYSELEIARTKHEKDNDKEKVIQLLNLFEQRTNEYEIPTLNERNNKPADYCRLYRQRFLPKDEVNKAAGAKIIWNNPPAKRYQPIADKALTDGLYGGTTYVESWVGWEGEDADFILDLGEEKTFTTIETDFLHQLGAWILLPAGGTYSVSTDNKNYHEFGSFRFAEDRDISVKFVSGKATVSTPVKARYIKVFVQTIGNCPFWHYGVGYPAWFFMDEITVK